MNIRDLEYFIAVVEFEHFGKAAKHCHVSQPTLSGQIKKLESELGVILFERSKRSVMITDAGKEIMAHARKVISGTHDIARIADSFVNPFCGQFRLGGIPTMATYLFPSVVSSVKKLMPELSLILVEDKTSDLLEKLDRGEIDAAFMALPTDDDFLESKELFKDTFFLAIPEGHEFAGLKSVGDKHLRNNQLLLLEEGHCLRGQALEACSMMNISEHDYMATSLETLRLMVKAGTGITIMPEMAIQDNEKDICYVPMESDDFSRIVGLVWRKTTVRKPVIDRLLSIFD